MTYSLDCTAVHLRILGQIPSLDLIKLDAQLIAISGQSFYLCILRGACLL